MVSPLRPIEPFVIPKIELSRPSAPSAPLAPSGVSAPGVTGETSQTSFTEQLREVVHSANKEPLAGEQVADAYASGKQNDLHGTMISLAQADVSLRLVANVRNRAIEAYREIMRMGA
jgi:flagellar hook-basal body complex protein FliE